MKTQTYFAYGSNLLRRFVLGRCASCRYLGLGRLDGWRLHHDGAYDELSCLAVGNILRSRGHSVWGALFELCADDAARLDSYPEDANDYVRFDVPVTELVRGRKVPALVYARIGLPVDETSGYYDRTLVESAMDAAGPVTYGLDYLNR
jgi:hypothetical protein